MDQSLGQIADFTARQYPKLTPMRQLAVIANRAVLKAVDIDDWCRLISKQASGFNNGHV